MLGFAAVLNSSVGQSAFARSEPVLAAAVRHAHVESWPAGHPPDPAPAAVAQRRARRGVWPIANGRIFAHVGLGESGRRLFGITGPHYQTRGNHQPLGAFDEQWFRVARSGAPLGVAVRTEWSELPGVACARTEETYADGTVLRVTDYAVAAEAAILRRLEIRVPSELAAERVGLRCNFSESPAGPLVVVEGIGRKRHRRSEAQTYRMLAPLLGRHVRSSVVPCQDGLELPSSRPLGNRVQVDLLLLTSHSTASE